METIQIRWLRDGAEAMSFEKAVGNIEEAHELFRRLSDILHHWWSRQEERTEGREG